MFSHCYVEKDKKYAKHFMCKKEKTLLKTCLFTVFSAFNAQKKVKRLETSFFGIRNDITKKCIFSVFLSFLRTKKIKRLQSTLLWRNRIILLKMCILSIFEFASCRDSKMHAKYPIWWNKIILPEKLWWVFFVDSYVSKY